MVSPQDPGSRAIPSLAARSRVRPVTCPAGSPRRAPTRLPGSSTTRPPWARLARRYTYNRTRPCAFCLSGTLPFASTNFRVDREPPITEGLLLRVAERLRVLGQPVRLRLIEQLKTGASTPQELSDAIGTSQQNVSKHLLVLHRAGVVSRRPKGSNVYYSLADESALVVLNEMLASVKRHLRELSELATQPPEED